MTLLSSSLLKKYPGAILTIITALVMNDERNMAGDAQASPSIILRTLEV